MFLVLFQAAALVRRFGPPARLLRWTISSVPTLASAPVTKGAVHKLRYTIFENTWIRK